MGAIGGEELMQGPDASDEKILVSVRVRPLNEKEIARNDVSDWECINDNTIIFRNNLPDRSILPTAYTFDRVFQFNCSTKQVYEEGAKEVALSVVSGINSSIFAYGQTSSGKTYTMSGITEHTVADIFEYIKGHEERAFVLKFSALEIYNEAVRDLLSADGSPLRLLDDPERGTIVEKLTEETLRDWSHFQELLSICEAQRQIGETSLNEMSSRSHQILRLTIESSARVFLGKDNTSTLEATVNFIDLAGSERASQTLSAGTRLKEGCHINRSLLTLGTVIRKLSKGRNGHIPYRDSKLTRILQSSLGGNSRTAIICTISPARSHVEQSRNTLLFASCAKEVATNAQVNVVMSDKTLVKHLQRELARLESELRSSGPHSATCDYVAMLREKDIQIEKMENEIEQLNRQRDLAQSQIENLLQLIEDNQASSLWVSSIAGFDGHSRSQVSTSEDEHSISEARFSTSQQSDGHDGSNLDEPYLRLSENPDEHFPSNGKSPQLPTNAPKMVEPNSCPSCKGILQETCEDLEDTCKEVRCIEEEDVNVNRTLECNVSLPEENEETLSRDEEILSSPVKEDRDSRHVHLDFTYDERKTIGCLFNSFPTEPSPWPLVENLSSSRRFELTRTRSCRATLMTGSSSPLYEKAQKNENTPPNGSEKDFPGRPEGLRRKLSILDYGADTEKLLEEDSKAFGKSIKTSENEDVTSIDNSVAGIKGIARNQSGKELVDSQVQESEVKVSESEKTAKDVGLDPMQEDLESTSNWPVEFERKQSEIIELWHTCNVSLVHRTCFFLLFKGDQADSIYMEVELRRLSFLKETFSEGNSHKLILEQGQTLTQASSLKNLRREREMLTKEMVKKFTEEERESLYKKWGIGLETKQRRLQLAQKLWTNTEDMNHIKDSAAIVAKLVGFLEHGEAPKEMFGLRFTPKHINRRSYSWKYLL